MKKSVILTGIATFAVAVIAVHAIWVPSVAVEPLSEGEKSIVPFEMMLKAHDLPTEAVKNPV